MSRFRVEVIMLRAEETLARMIAEGAVCVREGDGILVCDGKESSMTTAQLMEIVRSQAEKQIKLNVAPELPEMRAVGSYAQTTGRRSKGERKRNKHDRWR